MLEPSVRASHLKSLLAPAAPADAVRARLGADRCALLDEAAATDWLPFELEREACHALHATLAPAPLRDFHRAHMLAEFEAPLFRFLIQGAQDLLGSDAGAWARWIPRGWDLVFRGCGRWEVEARGPREVALVLADLPPVCLDPIWLRAAASALSAILPASRCEGELRLTGEELGARGQAQARYALRWRRLGEPADAAPPEPERQGPPAAAGERAEP